MNCPKREYLTLLESMIASNSDIIGSTLWKLEPTNLCNQLYNVMYTDWLRFRIFCHRRCEECQIVEDKLNE